jgi:carboxyl-terminal processing protease
MKKVAFRGYGTAKAQSGVALSLVAGLAVALAACGTTPNPATLPAAPGVVSMKDESKLFAETYESIIEYHIEATHADEVTLTGLGQLPVIDPNLAVSRDGKLVVLRRGIEVWGFTAPAPYDSIGWGTLTASLLAAAREASPAVAAVRTDKLDEAVIGRSLAALDPFSHYARPELAREWRAARDGFGGIGVSLNTDTGMRITDVMAGSPAEQAGIRADDRIVSLDGVPSASMSSEDIREHLRGPAMSKIVLGIQRAGLERPMSLSVQRAHLVPPSVTLKEQNDIAILKISTFNQRTGPDLALMMAKAHREMGGALAGIVLDLRDNPGGLLDQSIEVASQFLASGTVVTTIGRNPESFQYFAVPAEHVTEKLPVAVLVNGGSASASEIVAAALQDSGRAVVIGTASFGKGTVQTVLRTSNDGELTVTWAKLVTPKGYFLHHHGVVPTVCTANLPDDANANAILQKTPVARLIEARDDLNDTEWTDLRAACPAQRADRGIDVTLARQLLENPAAYSRATGGSAPRLAHNAPTTVAHNLAAGINR